LLFCQRFNSDTAEWLGDNLIPKYFPK